MSTPAPPARAANPAVLDALEMIINEATKIVDTEINPVATSVADSQKGLETQLVQLDIEMTNITKTLETVTLDPKTSERMEETRDVLKRTRRKLNAIRGRIGKLRMYEESDRLHLVEPPRSDITSDVSGHTETTAVITPDDLWSSQKSNRKNESQRAVEPGEGDHKMDTE